MSRWTIVPLAVLGLANLLAAVVYPHNPVWPLNLLAVLACTFVGICSLARRRTS